MRIPNLANELQPQVMSVDSVEKLNQMYGLNQGRSANLSLMQRAQRHMHILDSVGSVFFERQLEFLKAKTFDVEYADLPARTIFPTTNEAGPGKRTITYSVFDKVGQAKLVGNMADDLPRADVSGRQVTIPVKVLGISFGYDIQEIQSSQVAGGLPLDQRRSDAAARGMEESINTIGFNGEGDLLTSDGALPGLFNNPYVPRAAVADGASGDTRWSTKTPDEILADINTLFSTINVDSKLIERPNTLLLPVAHYNFINSTPRSSVSDTTILQYVVNNSQFISSAEDIMPINELAGAVTIINTFVPGGITGNDSDDLMIAYDRSADKLEFEIPVELTFLPVQERGLTFIVPAYSNIAGLNIYFPGSMFFAGGI